MRRSAVSFMQFGVGLFPWMNVQNSNFPLFLHVVNGARYQSSTTFSKIFLTTAISINKHMGYSYHYNFSILRYACFKGTHQNDFYDFSSYFFFCMSRFFERGWSSHFQNRYYVSDIVLLAHGQFSLCIDRENSNMNCSIM